MELSGYLLAAAGIVLLLFGRKLFWLLVAVTGFVIGYYLATPFVDAESRHIALIVGCLFGGVGALLAVFAQKIAVVAGGFLAGGFALSTLVQGMTTSTLPDWVPFIIGGAIGALLLKQLFEWSLIVLTSLLGAIVIIMGITGDRSPAGYVVLALAIVGFVVQARAKRGTKKKEE
jgi:hypothetical protein